MCYDVRVDLIETKYRSSLYDYKNHSTFSIDFQIKFFQKNQTKSVINFLREPYGLWRATWGTRTFRVPEAR
jgi:hypothetical protein